MADFGVPADDGHDGYLRMYLETMQAAQQLAFDVIRAAAAGNPVAMLEAAGDYLNNVDAVDDEGVALYEQARRALGDKAPVHVPAEGADDADCWRD